MTTFIALPCMDMMHTAFVHDLLQLQPDSGNLRFGIAASSLVFDARNNLAQQAIDKGAERILWLDSDMVFDPDLLQRLSADMDEGREFVSALCFTRKNPVQPCIYSEFGYHQKGRELEPFRVVMTDYPKDQIFEVAGSGFAAVMMTTDLFRRVYQQYGAPFTPQPGFGEDLSFCIRAGGIGAKMYCDSRIKVGHVGQIVINEQRYIEGLKL